MKITARSERWSLVMLAIVMAAMIANCFWTGWFTLGWWFALCAIVFCCTHYSARSIKLLDELERVVFK